MANSFLTMQNIARELLPILSDNLVMPQLVYKDYSEDFIRKGDTIQVERPVNFTADEFATSIDVQDLVEGNVYVKMDTIADVSFQVTAKDLALKIEDFRSKYLEPAAVAIAEKINDDGLNLYKYIPYYTGTSGTTPDALEDFANAGKVLNDNKVPSTPRYGIWDTSATAKFQILDSLVEVNKAGTNEALRRGQIGSVFNIDNFMSQAVKTHTAGGYAALADVTAAADVSAVNDTDSTTGFTYTLVELTSTAGTSTAKLLQGDLINLEDDSGNTYQCTVLEDTSAAISGVVSAKVYPAITADDLTDTDVTFPDVTADAHQANLVFHPKAFAFVTRPLDTPPGVESYTTSYNGITLRVTMDYDIDSKKTTMSIDTLYGYAPLYPELATRVLG